MVSPVLIANVGMATQIHEGSVTPPSETPSQECLDVMRTAIPSLNQTLTQLSNEFQASPKTQEENKTLDKCLILMTSLSQQISNFGHKI